MDVLYKYVTYQRALTCIPEVGDGTLRATQPAALNDPFECAVNATNYLFPNEWDENRQLADILTQVNESKPVTAEDVHLAREKYGSLFTRQLLAKQVSTRFGIVSFATDPLHPLLWSHYTTGGSGFAIGYDVDELHKVAGSDASLRRVEYQDRPILIGGPIVFVSPESNCRSSCPTRAASGPYEDEWRLIIELRRTIGTGQPDQHGQPINLVRIPNSAVVRVLYTERTPPESVKLIRDRLADRNNRYRVDKLVKLIMSSTTYGYEEAEDDKTPHR